MPSQASSDENRPNMGVVETYFVFPMDDSANFARNGGTEEMGRPPMGKVDETERAAKDRERNTLGGNRQNAAPFCPNPLKDASRIAEMANPLLVG